MNTDPKPNPIENPSSVNAERIETEIIRGDFESQPLYMQRSGRVITSALAKERGKLFDPSRLRESEVDQNTRALVAEVMKNAIDTESEDRSVYNEELNSQALEVIESNIGHHDRVKEFSSDEFDTTERNRKFFETTPSSPSSKRETYWNTLFFPILTPECREFARKYLEGKSIILLGGGRSRLLEEMNEDDIHPRVILNVDPYVEKPEEGSDTVVPMSATSKDFYDTILSLGIEKADEIWAEYSVPAYLENPEEIERLFDNIDQVLADNGTARIWPLEVGGSGDDGARLNRQEALITSLRKMDSSRKYEISVYKSAGRFGVTIHKLSFSAR